MTDAQKHIAAIRAALAMGPIPGVWYQGSATGAFKNCVYDKRVWWNADGSRGGDTPNLCVVLPESQETTAAYIAACHPDAMHAILAHIDQQAAEIARLREDADRLDWLDVTNARFRIGWRVGQAPIGNVNVQTIVQLGSGALTDIRTAIDAARKEADRG